MALRGVNLLLVWNGYEPILVDVFCEAGLSESKIDDLLSEHGLLP